ncbi:MAG TPA: patatin-like phospholipase family protein, partial [Nitrososphaera sp.]|nr:patatin-like phospholipase family protein [Nitrososphaera sp.]
MILLCVAFIASSRFKRWADLPPKQIVSIEEVVTQEATWISQRRNALGFSAAINPASKFPFVSDLYGLALSGGGIRSATVCLGFVTELMKLGLFTKFDYLSTVSGGGWLGCAVTAMLSDSRPDDVSPLAPHNYAYRLHELFRRGRVYIGAAKMVRAVVVMLFGVVITLITLFLIFYIFVVLMMLADAYYMLDSVREWSLWITSSVGPKWLYTAPRTENGLSQFRPYEAFPVLLLITTIVLLIAIIFKLLEPLFTGERFQRVNAVISSAAIRLFLFSAVLVCALQGRELLTAILCSIIGFMLLSIIGRPRMKLPKFIGVLLFASAP